MATSSSTPNGVDRIESAANINLVVTRGTGSGEPDIAEVPISRLDTTKDINIQQVHESSVKATGYSILAIKYSGTMMYKGSTLTRTFNDSGKSLNNLLYDENGVPVPVSITVNHELNAKADTYQTVLVTSESYQVRTEEMTETAYDFIAMDRTSDQPDSAS